MLRTTRLRSMAVAAVLSVATTLIGVPIGVSAHGTQSAPGAALPAAAPAAASQHLAPTLTSDGTFIGAPGVQGTIDTGAWSLVSDPAIGQPPRFAQVNPYAPLSSGTWSTLGSNGSGDGALSGIVYALAVSGSNLYVGGSFADAAGIPGLDYLAMWNGSAWSQVGTYHGAINDTVYALAVSGTDLYVGGDFTDAGGIATADKVARWDGTSWHALGSNAAHDDGALTIHNFFSSVMAIAVSGTDVYVGGLFSDAAGIANADSIAMWDGSSWSALGSNGAGDGAIGGGVDSLAMAGTDLYVGGQFDNAAGNAFADNIAMWDGTSWSALGSNPTHDDGAIAAPNPVENDYSVYALALIDGDLYVGGDFLVTAATPRADNIAMWDGTTWSAVGSNGSGGAALNDVVSALAVSGTDLYVGGEFTDAAGAPRADRVAMWDGTSWSALGSNGAGGGALNNRVYALAVSGIDVYAGGYFTDAATIATADDVAKWHPTAASTRKPDGRVRLGSTGAFVGDDVYNTTGIGQSVGGGVSGGGIVAFGISIQNDGVLTERLKVKGTKSTSANYTVRYTHGKTNITKAVVAGTFKTPLLAFGASYLITVSVTVASTAPLHTRLTLLATISSVGNTNAKDVVKFSAWRA